jgi:CheY-like chemotaxis protein
MHVCSILFVDANENVRTIGEMCLENHFDVYVAESGAACLMIAHGDQPDLIVLDLEMPFMNGMTTLIKLRENPLSAGIPVILTYPQGHTPAASLYQKFGIIGGIEKPFDPIALPAQIRNSPPPRFKLRCYSSYARPAKLCTSHSSLSLINLARCLKLEASLSWASRIKAKSKYTDAIS